VDLDQWIAQEVERSSPSRRARPSSTATAVNKPKGFINYTARWPMASWSWGNLGYIATGVAGASRPNPSDKLVDTDLRAEGGLSPERHIRDEPQDAGGDPQVQGHRRQLSVAAAGAPPAARATLMTFPLIEAEDMPDIGANSLSIAFGDFRAAT
jgi:predicted phage gp36 major capsid-like protein